MSKAIKQFSPFEKELAVFKEKYVGVVYDFTVKKNEKQARSDRFAIGKAVSALDAVHKELKAPLLEKTKLLDGRRKEIKDELLAIQGDIKSQIEKHEQIEKDRVEDIQGRIAHMKSAPDRIHDFVHSDAIKLILIKLEGTKIDDSFAEFQQEALFTKMDAVMAIQPVYEARFAAEEEEAEREEARRVLEEKARLEREEDIRRQAQLEAERVSIQQIKIAEEAAANAVREAEERAEKSRLDAIQAEAKAKETAAAAKRHEERLAEQKLLDEKAEEDRRVADKEHRIKIEQGVIDGLIKAGLELMDVKVVIDAINRNEVPNLTINY